MLTRIVVAMLCIGLWSVAPLVYGSPVAIYSSESNHWDLARPRVTICEIHDDKIMVKDSYGGVGASLQKSFHLMGQQKLRQRFANVINGTIPRTFRSSDRSKESTQLTVYAEPGSEGVVVYSVHDDLVMTYGYQNSSSTRMISDSLNMLQEIAFICETFGNVMLHYKRQPSNGLN